MQNPSGTGQGQPEQQPGAGGGPGIFGAGLGGSGGSVFGNGGAGRPPSQGPFAALGGGGQPQPSSTGAAGGQPGPSSESQPAPGQGGSQAQPNPSQPNPAGPPPPADGAPQPERPGMPAQAPGGTGRDLGQIDSSSHNRGQPPLGQAGPLSGAPLSKEQIDRGLMGQSQAQLQLLLNRWLRRDERALHENARTIASALGEVNLAYRLNREDLSPMELERSIMSPDRNFQWSDWMMLQTGRDKRPFGSGTSAFGPAGGDQQLPGEGEEARRKLSPLLRKELLVPLCEQFNLEPEVALKLLDQYFCERPKDSHFLYSLEQELGRKEAELAPHRQTLEQLKQMPARPHVLGGFGQPHNPQIHAQRQALEATIASLTPKHEMMLKAFRDQIQTIKRQLLQFYMHERSHVLENLTTIFAHSSPLPSRRTIRPMIALRAELLKQERLVARLIENLKRNLRWDTHEFKGLDEQQRPVVLSFIQREQIMMLELLFSIAQEQNLQEGQVDIDVSHLAGFYEYLALNDFSGQLICVSGQPDSIRYQHSGMDSLTDAQRIAQNKIKDLGIVTFLAMLRIDVFQAVGASPEAVNSPSPESKNLLKAWVRQNAQPQQQDLRSLRQNVKNTRLDPRNSIVCLALLQVFRRIEQLIDQQQDFLLQPPQDFMRELLRQPFVSELDTILRQSPLLSVPGRSSSSRLDDDASAQTAINGEFLKVLKSFINLIYEPILEKHRREDDIQAVRAVTLDVLLKNPQLLRDVWRQIDASRRGQEGPKDIMDASTSFSTTKMFERTLKTPLASLPFYTFLLRAMCGKNRNKHAEYVFRMLDLQFVKAVAPHGNDESELLTVEELGRKVPHTRLLHEMLVALILLLSEFNQIATRASQVPLDPARTDVLMNLIVIFSKIIKQSPQLCTALAGALVAIVAGRSEQNGPVYQTEGLCELDLNAAIHDLIFDSPEQEELEQRPEPALLNLLISCLFILMKLQAPAITSGVLKHVMDAVSSVFSAVPWLKKCVLDSIYFNQGKYQLNLTSYFFRNCQEHERAESDLKCTVSYLKFITKVFKTDYPQMLLSRHWHLHISHSILDEMLRVFYRKMVKEFFRLEFRSIGGFAKFAKRVLKLTYTLLAKFDSGDSPIMRIECKQPCPRFDPLLNLIAESLNDVNLDLIMQPLELEEMTGFAQSFNNIRQSFLQNKFHAKLINRQTATASSGRHFGDLGAAHGPRPSVGTNIAHEKILVNDMISQSLKCINQMMRLCVQVETTNLHLLDKEGKPKSENFLDTRGVKLHYAQKLSFLKDLRQQLMEPSGVRGHLAGDSLSTKHNVVSLMAFYAKAECEAQAPAPGAGSDQQQGAHMLISSASQIKIETNVLATSCLKMYCQLWRTQPSQRVDIKQYLLKNGFLLPEDLKNIFLVPLVAALRHLSGLQRLPQGGASPEQRAMVRILRRYLTQMFELLTLCAHTQKPFLLLLLQQRPGAPSSATQSLVQQLISVLGQFFDSLGASLEQRDDASRQMVRTLCQRIVSFLSVMVQEKTATDFVKDLFELAPSGRGAASGPPRQFLRRISEILILPICVADGMTKTARLDLKLENHLEFNGGPGEELFDFYQQERACAATSSECDRILTKAHNHCTSILTIVEFLKLVQGLFAIDPIQNAQLRAVIAELFTEKRFGHFMHTPSIVELKRDASQTSEELAQHNEAFMQAASYGRSQQVAQSFRRDQWQIIERENLLLNDQHCSPLTHALVSKPVEPGRLATAPVHLSEIDSYHTISALTFLHRQILGPTAHSHFCQSNALAASFSGVFSPPGGLGANFFLSTPDIKYTFLANGYHDLNSINHLTTLAAKYNLAMSSLWCQQQLVQAKDSFMMNVGRVKLSQNLRGLPSVSGGAHGGGPGNGVVKSGGSNRSFQILASMFPLVDKDFPRDVQSRLSPQEVIGSVNRLVKANLMTIKGVFEQLKQDLRHRSMEESRRAETIYLSAKHSETTFEYLETVLSSLNLCVSPSALMNLCPVEQLEDTRELVDFLCKDFLVHLPQVFHDHLSRLSASSGSFGAGSSRDALVAADHAPFRARASSHSSLFMQLVLSSFQILESITKDEQFDHRNQRAQGIQACLPQVVRLMSARPAGIGSLDPSDGRGSLFQTCVRALQVSIDLLSERSVQEFMDRGREQPLGLVIKRLIDAKNCNVEETIMIVQFLNTYAQSRNGALHLVRENIFQHLLSSPCIAQAQAHDFYLKPGHIGGGQRDPFSILWLQVLLLVRSLNEQLLDEEVHLGDPRHQQRADPQSYLRSVVGFLQQQRIDFRVSRLLCPPQQDQLITQAQLEETELTVCIICQLFMQAELLGKASYGLLQGLKDCLLFGTTRLLSRFAYGLNADIRVASPTEKYLKNQTAFSILQQHKRSDPARQQPPASAFANQEMGQGFSLFDLKAQMQAVKILMTSSGALLNLLLQDKELSSEFAGASAGGHAASPYRQGPSMVNALFPTNWHYLHTMLGNARHSNSVFEDFNKSYICSELAASLRAHAEARGQGALLQSSVELAQRALSALQIVYKQWTANLPETRILLRTLKHTFQNDDAISGEYFGLNSIFMSCSSSGANGQGNEFEDFMEMFETAMEMGNQLAALLLEKMYECSKGQVRSAAFGSQVGLSQRGVMECAKQFCNNLASLEKDVELGLQQQGASVQLEAGKSSQIDGGQGASSKEELVRHCRALQAWTNEMAAHAQASHGSSRASLVHGLASASAYTPEKNMIYETERFGLGNPQGFDRGGGPPSAAPGSAMAPGGSKSASNDQGAPG